MDRIAAAGRLRHRFVGMSDAVAVLDPVGHPEVLFVPPERGALPDGSGPPRSALERSHPRALGRIGTCWGDQPPRCARHDRPRSRSVGGVPETADGRRREGCRRRHHDGLRSACPIYPGKRYEDWDFADPGEARFVDEVRTIRDEMDERITKLVGELLAPVRPRDHAAARSSGEPSPRRELRPRLRGAIAHELF